MPSFDRVAEATEQPVVDPAELSAFETASGTPRSAETEDGPQSKSAPSPDISFPGLLAPDSPDANSPAKIDTAGETAQVASLVEEVPKATKVSSSHAAVPPVQIAPAHVVQLGVFSSEAKAARLKQRLTAAPDGALYGVDIRVVRRTGAPGKMYHYVETAAIPEQSVARELCTTLKGLGQDCVPVTR